MFCLFCLFRLFACLPVLDYQFVYSVLCNTYRSDPGSMTGSHHFRPTASGRLAEFPPSPSPVLLSCLSLAFRCSAPTLPRLSPPLPLGFLSFFLSFFLLELPCSISLSLSLSSSILYSPSFTLPYNNLHNLFPPSLLSFHILPSIYLLPISTRSHPSSTMSS